MFPFNNSPDSEDNSIIHFNIQVNSPFLFSEDDITHTEKNDIFSEETEKILYDLFGYKGNENTNTSKNEFNSDDSLDTDNDIVRPSLLQIKRNRDNDIENTNNEINEEVEVNDVIIENNQQNSNKEIKSNKNKEHTKNTKDNIIYKLKGNFINKFVIDSVNQNLINKKDKLKKLRCKKFIADLKLEKNIALFKMTMSDILCQQKISSKYSKFDEYENKKISYFLWVGVLINL